MVYLFDHRDSQKHLIGEFRQIAMVAFLDRYYLLPKSLGDSNVSSVLPNSLNQSLIWCYGLR